MVASKDYDMDTADSIVAPVRGLETVTVTVAKYPQCGVVGVLETREANSLGSM